MTFYAFYAFLAFLVLAFLCDFLSAIKTPQPFRSIFGGLAWILYGVTAGTLGAVIIVMFVGFIHG